MTKTHSRRFGYLVITLLLMGFSVDAFGQMERRLVQQDRPVELTFMAPRNINLHTIEPLAKGEMHYAIMHAFGEVSNGWRNFYGIDNGANIRFSLEYGFTERLSTWIGRSGEDKVFEAGARYVVLRQMTSGDMPISLGINGNIGLNSSDLNAFVAQEYEFYERVSYFVSVPIARKENDRLSYQLTPMLAHFNRVGPEISIPLNENTYFGIGTSLRYKLRGRLALTGQYVYKANRDVADNIAIGLDIETGGHVFQLFFTTTRSLTDQYVLASDNGNPLDGGLRFGFNVNRLFSIK